MKRGGRVGVDTGPWVSLAYTRAFGTLGLRFKSGRTHQIT